MPVRSYQDLIAWKKGVALVVEIYSVTRGFPKEELYGLTSQMRRAAISVPSNIAEGQGRMSTGEFNHFLGNARGSLLELETQLHIALQLGMSAGQWQTVYCIAQGNWDVLSTDLLTRSNAPREGDR